MNIFSQFGGSNSCLWILILLLIALSFSGNSLCEILSGGCTPLLLALAYTMWRNGTLSNLLCGNGNGNGCGCGCGN